mgnify:CR=1 FL=1
MSTKKQQTITEEWFNAISHGITGLTAIAGMVVLIVMAVNSDQQLGLFSALFYGISLVCMYSMSAIYHAVQHIKIKRFFNIMDHISIFLLIAGTYTPIVLLSIGGTAGWVLFGLQWGIALLGSFMKVFFTGRFETVSLVLYGVMGWMIVFRLGQLTENLPSGAFWLLVAGGITYTLGIVFYVIDTRMKLAHFIWHVFVIAGSLLHYLMMVLYVF